MSLDSQYPGTDSKPVPTNTSYRSSHIVRQHRMHSATWYLWSYTSITFIYYSSSGIPTIEISFIAFEMFQQWLRKWYTEMSFLPVKVVVMTDRYKS